MELILKTAGVFVLLLGVLVAVHELGHFTVAKLLGMNVQEFSLGFGPILRRLFRRNGTEYNVRVVPLGGFVRIAGMEPGEDGEIEGGFNSRPIWQRTLVILAGPFMSLVLGYFVFLMIGFVWGFPSETAPPTLTVGMVAKGKPAEKAGFQVGDTVVGIGGKPIRQWKELQTAARSSDGKELTFEVKRDGKPVSIAVRPILSEPDEDKKRVWQVGLVPEPTMVRAGFYQSIRRGTAQTAFIVRLIFTKVFSREITKNVGGIVMIGYATAETVKSGPYDVMMLLGGLSLMLGILNLLPWPILDGGHILLLVIEKIRGRKLEPASWYVVQSVGLAVIVFLALFMVYYDFARILTHKLP